MRVRYPMPTLGSTEIRSGCCETERLGQTWCCERESCMDTLIPVGACTNRTADSVRLTCCVVISTMLEKPRTESHLSAGSTRSHDLLRHVFRVVQWLVGCIRVYWQDLFVRQASYSPQHPSIEHSPQQSPCSYVSCFEDPSRALVEPYAPLSPI